MSMKDLTVSKYLQERLALCGRPQRDIARACGYPHPNIITMFKQGRTRVPLEKVGAIAKAVDGDPGLLLRLVFREYHPEAWQTIQGLLGRDRLLTDGEIELVEYLRELGATDPIDLTVLENRRILGEAFEAICHRERRKAGAAVAALNALPKNARNK